MAFAPHHQPTLALTEPEQAPRLAVSLNGWKKLSAKVANWPGTAIAVTIKRERDGSGRPCVFRWSPENSPLILRLLSNNGEMQEAPVTASTPPRPTLERPFSANSKDTLELGPAAETTIYATLPEWYGSLLDVGDHLGQGQNLLALEPPVPRIPLTLSVSPGPLIDPSARLPGAPVLTITLSVDDGRITGREWDVELKVTTKITYHGSHFLLDRSHGEATWERCQPVFPCGVGVYPIDVPRGFAQAHPSLFVSLQPDPCEFPPDVAIGDIFRLQHRGDLAVTLALFPYINETLVAYPKDLEGRLKLVVPASDAIELVYEEHD
ncbi:hypothetical protein BJX65DRAFT_321155 [Aspergillus insuetus]